MKEQPIILNINRGLVGQARKLMDAAEEGGLSDFLAIGFIKGEPWIFSEISVSRKLQTIGLLHLAIATMSGSYEVEKG